ncbi:aldo/keto reductase [Nocardioides sp.]|uniref:aldo/keto reductase n=1 Tax=Nocardioides sp. TaxID=35761 RepID=UPI001A23107F|nr:aldo/keto reductase [Nocardioides sp.]MBJ7355716.1 aldo/keto reductase [Nocardioides sp.]
MQTRRLGDRTVSAIGLGGMPMSVRPVNDEEQGIATIRTAVENGVTLIDTADAYCRDESEFGHNEVLIAKALAQAGAGPDDVLVATKGGHTRTGTAWTLDGRPEYLREACVASARRLGVEQIGLYQFHRPDPAVPYADSIGGLKALLDEGLIATAGISNADPEQIRLAHEILGAGLVSVQNQYSPSFRSSEPEIDVCDELGLAFLPWSPLGGMGGAAGLGDDFAVFGKVAAKHGVSPQQVALAWELARSGNVVPIPGASRPESVTDSVAAVHLQLDDEDLAQLASA